MQKTRKPAGMVPGIVGYEHRIDGNRSRDALHSRQRTAVGYRVNGALDVQSRHAVPRIRYYSDPPFSSSAILRWMVSREFRMASASDRSISISSVLLAG